MEEYYYISKRSIQYCYPCEYDKTVTEYGVLEKYIGKRYTREEMDKIIAEMIIRHPYIEGSMRLNLSVMKFNKGRSYYHMLDFRNYNYKNQKKGNMDIKFEKK